MSWRQLSWARGRPLSDPGGDRRGEAEAEVGESHEDLKVHLAIGQCPVRLRDVLLRDPEVERAGPELVGAEVEAFTGHGERVEDVGPARGGEADALEGAQEDHVVEAGNVVAHPRVALHQGLEALTNGLEGHS